MLEMTKDKHVEPESHFRIENSGKYLCYSVTCDCVTLGNLYLEGI
jgi:hypothetical protein